MRKIWLLKDDEKSNPETIPDREPDIVSDCRESTYHKLMSHLNPAHKYLFTDRIANLGKANSYTELSSWSRRKNHCSTIQATNIMSHYKKKADKKSTGKEWNVNYDVVTIAKKTEKRITPFAIMEVEN